MMRTWTYTSYESGEPVTYKGLSWEQAVRALERAMSGLDPFEGEDRERETAPAQETAQAEQPIAA